MRPTCRCRRPLSKCELESSVKDSQGAAVPAGTAGDQHVLAANQPLGNMAGRGNTGGYFSMAPDTLIGHACALAPAEAEGGEARRRWQTKLSYRAKLRA